MCLWRSHHRLNACNTSWWSVCVTASPTRGVAAVQGAHVSARRIVLCSSKSVGIVPFDGLLPLVLFSAASHAGQPAVCRHFFPSSKEEKTCSGFLLVRLASRPRRCHYGYRAKSETLTQRRSCEKIRASLCAYAALASCVCPLCAASHAGANLQWASTSSMSNRTSQMALSGFSAALMQPWRRLHRSPMTSRSHEYPFSEWRPSSPARLLFLILILLFMEGLMFLSRAWFSKPSCRNCWTSLASDILRPSSSL